MILIALPPLRSSLPPSVQVLNSYGSKSALRGVIIRTIREAIQSGQGEVELKHLVAALIGYPNGPARFDLQEAMRVEGTNEPSLRKMLGLREVFKEEITQINEESLDMSVVNMNRRVDGVFKILLGNLKDSPHNTGDLLSAVLKLLPKTDEPITPARLLVKHIKDGNIF